MTIPSAMLDDSIYKMITQTREEFLDRLRNNDNRFGISAAVHNGVPSPDNLPKDDVGVWLNLAQVSPDPDSPFGGEIFVAQWDIIILARDHGDDPHGYDPSTADEAMGAIIEMLTETTGDTALNGAIEFLEIGGVSGIPPQQLSGGDGLVAGYELDIRCHMNMFPIRCPP